ncbi:lipoyl domain of the dihydrolipoyl acyltransferase component (E2) [Zalerion maritima]|uniref:Lipoyl domain of the dihydrolipoyl acyltransferase component (E2) n=1 Tax=Zalerion maritima TaxID=339359 RepID=A0AAD5WRQ6_9PEZI|nr:lipoyl domain of the dihydrolipoyl acyltransferase component (E2) [Zalerion maritima]
MGRPSHNSGYRTSAACLAASNFTMPALSPTMTEGNITTWKLKEGDSYAAGDVLLEIETDKATMDVEAQDEGILMKITQADRTKAVKVGSRIAVIAESGDDISALEMPPDETPAPIPEKKESPPPSSAEPKSESSPKKNESPKKPAAPQTYPLFPAVKQLMKQKGVEDSEVSKMTPTGPKGRLLKGDVLAYLGLLDSNSPKVVQARFEKLSHLDLSNVKPIPAKGAPKKVEEKKAAPPAPPLIEKLDVALAISLAPVLEAQKRLKDTLGVDMPLSSFISRATDVANDGLPLPASYKPTADELFDQVLGLDSLPKSSKGVYLPQITALPPAEKRTPRAAPSTKPDIIDILAGSPKRITPKPMQSTVAFTTGTNVFILSVPKAEEKRAKVFLERVKVVLENEPGRLVL